MSLRINLKMKKKIQLRKWADLHYKGEGKIEEYNGIQ